MNDHFFEVRAEMSRQKISGREMAERMGLSPGAFSARICGRIPFTLKEAYLILRILGIPADLLSMYFPIWEVLT